MRLGAFEFYATPEGEIMVSSEGNPLKVYEMSDRELTTFMIERLSNFYPDALEALSKTYEKSKQNKIYFEYLIVHRFIRCNFSAYDSRPDIQDGCFKFEFVPCPLRGECKYCNVICNPSFNSNLSLREMEVMKLYFNSVPEEKIAEMLFISIYTVKKHKRNVLEKLSLHSLSEFISHASKFKMFEK